MKKFNTIWDKVSADIKRKFHREPVYNRTFLKSYGDEVTDFPDNEIPNSGSEYACLAVISLDSALKKDENYYPQLFLKEYKYFEKEVIRHVIEDPEISYDESDEE